MAVTAPILIFRPVALSREAALLGRMPVATIVPFAGRYRWALRIAPVPFVTGVSSSIDAARRKIEHEVREWFISAGLLDIARSMVVFVEEETKGRARA